MSSLTPRPGFDPARIAWEGPDEVPGTCCCYCGDAIPDEAVPLTLWDHGGWTARFCGHCEAAWFGLQRFDGPDDEADAVELGSCCLCERRRALFVAASCIAMVAFLAGCAAANRIIGCVASAVPAVTCQGGEPGR